MTKEHAAQMLHPDTTAQVMAGYLLADPSGDSWSDALNEACRMGAEALRSPWVRTADWPPTHKDAYLREKVLARGRDNNVAMAHYAHVRDFPNIYIWWMPIPPLPEAIK